MAINLIQSTTIENYNSHPQTLAFVSGVTKGNLLIAVGGVYNTTNTPIVSTFSDSQSNSYTKIYDVSCRDSGQLSMAFAIASSSAANTITFDLPASTSQKAPLAIFEYSGITASDQKSTNTGGSCNASNPGSITTSVANELILAISINTFGAVPTAPTGYTLRQSQVGTAGPQGSGLAVYDQIVSSQGSYSVVIGTGGNYQVPAIVSFFVPPIPSGGIGENSWLNWPFAKAF